MYIIFLVILWMVVGQKERESAQQVLKHSSTLLRWDIVTNQLTEREILLAQIEPLECTSSVFGYPNFDEYILRKQYEEANDFDDIRLGEYEIHIFGKTQKAFLKWSEGSNGEESLKEEPLVEATVCKKGRQLYSMQETTTPSAIVDGTY